MATEIILATGNDHKITELSALLAQADLSMIKIHSLREYPNLIMPEETGTTFIANAKIKAEAVANETGLTALADDSGLSVDYLQGAPGVHSARFAMDEGFDHDDQANNAKLLRLMQGVAPKQRSASFVCAIAIATPNKPTLTVEEECSGYIAKAPSGNRGFGYDPLFFLEESQCTMAELPAEEKNRISHRARALAKTIPLLKERLGL